MRRWSLICRGPARHRTLTRTVTCLHRQDTQGNLRIVLNLFPANVSNMWITPPCLMRNPATRLDNLGGGFSYQRGTSTKPNQCHCGRTDHIHGARIAGASLALDGRIRAIGQNHRVDDLSATDAAPAGKGHEPALFIKIEEPVPHHQSLTPTATHKGAPL